jgi:hypothetical protein
MSNIMAGPWGRLASVSLSAGEHLQKVAKPKPPRGNSARVTVRNCHSGIARKFHGRTEDGGSVTTGDEIQSYEQFKSAGKAVPERVRHTKARILIAKTVSPESRASRDGDNNTFNRVSDRSGTEATNEAIVGLCSAKSHFLTDSALSQPHLFQNSPIGRILPLAEWTSPTPTLVPRSRPF